MARATVVPVQLKVVHVLTTQPSRIVHLGAHGFNPGQIVALSNSGDDHTVVHTERLDFVVDMPLQEAIHVLNGEDPADYLPAQAAPA